MKVVFAAKSIYPFHPIGGVQKYAFQLAKNLVKEGIELEIIAPLDNGAERNEVFEGIKYRLLKPSIYKYLEYPIGWLGVHRFSISLARYLKGINFDLLHSFDMTAYRYLKDCSERKPVIAHIFSDNYLCNPISIVNPINYLGLFGIKTEKIKKKKIELSPFSDIATKLKY